MFDSWGDPDDPVVFLLHGGGQTRQAWRSAASMLAARGFRVIAPDARGHGDSGWAVNGDYSDDAMVADLKHLVGMTGRENCHFVGASLGGSTAMLAIGEGAIRAGGLVLADIVPAVDTAGARAVLAFMGSHGDGFSSLDEVAEAVGRYLPHRVRPANTSGLLKNVRLRADGRYYWHWDPRFAPKNPDFEARLRRHEAAAANLTVPTLLVRGELSKVVTVDAAARFLELCPAAEYVTVRDADHMVAGDKNDVFLSSTIAFLERVSER